MKKLQPITLANPKYNANVPRIEKSFNLIGKVTITNQELGYATVQSQSNPNKFYNVCWKTNDCDCSDCTFRKLLCKHIRAVVAFVEMTDKK